MLEHLKQAKNGLNLFHFPEEKLYLNLFIGDVKDYLIHLPENVDAWFLDGFSPATNPEMWCDEIFTTMKEKSSHDSSFATFTSAGFVKRALKENGFLVKKVKGFGRKRDMLCGVYS
jgi:tRNA 5-methylaminomethyl-2-thiouridine biosynthesis bifunctional protein